MIVNPSTTPEPDLQIALDSLVNHTKVAGFISWRLIQRLVKSDPIPGYVKDIATLFHSRGGSLQAVFTAYRDSACWRPNSRFSIGRAATARLNFCCRSVNTIQSEAAFRKGSRSP